jgi:hypothetical protein
MSRTAASLLAVWVLLSVGNANAKEPHQEWMEFLKGEWTYEYPSLDIKGEVKYTWAAKRTALVARAAEEENAAVELVGWRPDTKKIVIVGYGAANNSYWHTEHDELRGDRVAGPTSGILPDGRPFKGKVVIERAGDDCFEVHLKLTSGDEDITAVGKFTRKQQ